MEPLPQALPTIVVCSFISAIEVKEVIKQVKALGPHDIATYLAKAQS